MSKYKNIVFIFCVHSTVDLPAWRPKDANVTLMYFPRVFTETITPERKNFFQNFMINVFKIDEIRKELSTSYFVM